MWDNFKRTGLKTLALVCFERCDRVSIRMLAGIATGPMNSVTHATDRPDAGIRASITRVQP